MTIVCLKQFVSTVFIGSLVHCQSLLPILIKYLIYLLEFIQFNVFLSFSTIFVILLKRLYILTCFALNKMNILI